MSLHGNDCTTSDGKWTAYVEVEHFLGDTTAHIYINDAMQKASRRVAKDRVLLYDVQPTDMYFSRDRPSVFLYSVRVKGCSYPDLMLGVKVVYHLPTGVECTPVGDRWVLPEKKGRAITGDGGVRGVAGRSSKALAPGGLVNTRWQVANQFMTNVLFF